MIKEGAGTLYLYSSNHDYTGDVSLNAGQVYYNAERALGMGHITVASGASLYLSNTAGLDEGQITANSGSTIILTENYNPLSIYGTYKTYSYGITGLAQGASIITGSTTNSLRIVGEIASGAVENADSADAIHNAGYTRSEQGYTVDTSRAYIQDDVRLVLNGDVTTIKGTYTNIDLSDNLSQQSTYYVHSLVMGNGEEQTVLNIDSGNMSIVNTTASSNAATAAFMLSTTEGSHNVINVSGGLTLHSAISDGAGSGEINVKNGGFLHMRQGLVTTNSGGTKEINVESGGTLHLSNQLDTTNYGIGDHALIVNIADGATLAGRSLTGFSGEVNVYTQLNFTGETKKLSIDPGLTDLYIHQALQLGELHVESDYSSTTFLGGAGTTNTISTINMTQRYESAPYISTLGTLHTDKITGRGVIAMSRDTHVIVAENAFDFVTAKGDQAISIRQSAYMEADSRSSFSAGYVSNISLSNAHFLDGFTANGATELDHITMAAGETLRISGGQARISNSDLTGVSINLTSTGSALVSNTILGEGTNFTISGESNSLTFRDITIDTGLLSISLGGEIARSQSVDKRYLASGLMSALVETQVEGSLTLNLGDLDGLITDFNSAYASGQSIGLELVGVSELEDILGAGMDHQNILLQIEGYNNPFSIKSTEIFTPGGNITLVLNSMVPEPSSATLSLLALAGLALRRRRARD